MGCPTSSPSWWAVVEGGQHCLLPPLTMRSKSNASNCSHAAFAAARLTRALPAGCQLPCCAMPLQDCWVPQLSFQVEAELRRVPRQLAAGLDASLWSIVYMPQARRARGSLLLPCLAGCCLLFVVRLEGSCLPAHYTCTCRSQASPCMMPNCRSALWCGWRAAACRRTWRSSCRTTSSRSRAAAVGR